MKKIQEILGHSSIVITADTYTLLFERPRPHHHRQRRQPHPPKPAAQERAGPPRKRHNATETHNGPPSNEGGPCQFIDICRYAILHIRRSEWAARDSNPEPTD